MTKTRIVVYPTVFIHDTETDTMTVIFPDVPSAISQAATLGKAMLNAQEVLGLMLYDVQDLPTASSLEQVQAAYPHDQVQLTAVDLSTVAKDSHAPTNQAS
jgi:predicted RNase H-like HicB family nuclease